VSICAQAYLQTDNAKKNTQKIGQKHRTPSEKEKKGTPKVFQRLYVFHLHTQRNHSLNKDKLKVAKKIKSDENMWVK
jgi:hypothetical protein